MGKYFFLFVLAACFAAVPARAAEMQAPDVLAKSVTDEVLAVVRADKDIQSGHQKKVLELVEAKVLPHFNFEHMARLAMGKNWRQASAAQQKELTSEFRALLVRTYTTAFTQYKNQTVEYRPLRTAPDETDVIVKSLIKQPSGQPIAIEFLSEEPSFTPHHLPYIKNLETLGFEATLRLVDPVQYRARVDNFDFDITVERMSFSSTLGDSLRGYFTAQAARTKGSQNLAGIADPAVDALVDIIIAAKTRPELVTACKALDRVIRAGRYWIPHWYLASHRIAFWDVFAHPAAQPRYFRGIPDTWWYDKDKAAKLEKAG